jgi:hypothetical protein
VNRAALPRWRHSRFRPWSSTGSADDYNVALGVRHHLLTHPPQQQAGKATVATAPNHKQVGAAGEVDQNLRRVAHGDFVSTGTDGESPSTSLSVFCSMPSAFSAI